VKLKRTATGRRITAFWLGVLLVGTFYLALDANSLQRVPGPLAPSPSEIDRTLLDRYCVTCHNDWLKTAELSLSGIDTQMRIHR
jgi:hypothetical protein